jgi:hypothetical protein
MMAFPDRLYRRRRFVIGRMCGFLHGHITHLTAAQRAVCS